MLFSQNKCFFKRQKPVPPTLDLQSTSGSFSDQETLHSTKPRPPYEMICTTVTVSNEPTQPPKAYAAKPSAPPIPHCHPQPVWTRQWSNFESKTWTPSLSGTSSRSSQQSSQGPHFWAYRKKSEKGSLFRNAGLDENGQLKSEYEEIQGADWGEPDEWL